ncbi:MAG: methionine--tRNA ligase [Candidatus Chisholmbacteria bacterium]|nr:methionine--tRNA ligase [Candidatus Chisholmbacteria bacterium]
MKDQVSFVDFSKLDLRVGTIVKVETPEGSRTMYRLTVDLGPSFAEATEGKERIIFAGIKEAYSPDELVGEQVVVVVNLEPKKIMGEESQGMLLAACETDDQPVVVVPKKQVKNGSVVR